MPTPHGSRGGIRLRSPRGNLVTGFDQQNVVESDASHCGGFYSASLATWPPPRRREVGLGHPGEEGGPLEERRRPLETERRGETAVQGHEAKESLRKSRAPGRRPGEALSHTRGLPQTPAPRGLQITGTPADTRPPSGDRPRAKTTQVKPQSPRELSRPGTVGDATHPLLQANAGTEAPREEIFALLLASVTVHVDPSRADSRGTCSIISSLVTSTSQALDVPLFEAEILASCRQARPFPCRAEFQSFMATCTEITEKRQRPVLMS
uniref:uncharacterized protein LOC132690768 n=1 Tax=Panthera onca TaxID=9690 RepID=UPI002954BF0F|nr:uncharacterized protein LOC132690768 [Panthera onca]